MTPEEIDRRIAAKFDPAATPLLPGLVTEHVPEKETLMITFLDGPAMGQTMNLNRAPVLLRVVKAPEKWDACDLEDDFPAPEEEVHVYILVGTAGAGFWDSRNPAGRRVGGVSLFGSYRYVPTQPPREVLYDNTLWQVW